MDEFDVIKMYDNAVWRNVYSNNIWSLQKWIGLINNVVREWYRFVEHDGERHAEVSADCSNRKSKLRFAYKQNKKIKSL